MRCRRRRPGVGARGVVVAPTADVRESVVSIVDLLKFLGACWTGRVVVGYAIGVVLEGCSERALAGVSGLGREGGTVYRPRGSGFGLRWRKPQGYHLGRGGVRSGGKRSGQKKAYSSRPRLVPAQVSGASAILFGEQRTYQRP